MNVGKSEVSCYLEKVKLAISKDNYRIAMNDKREDNRALMKNYRISRNDVKKILMNLKVMEFSEKRIVTKEGFEGEELYIFGKDVELFSLFEGRIKKVTLYIKLNKVESDNGEFVYVVSFHEAKFPMKYSFKL